MTEEQFKEAKSIEAKFADIAKIREKIKGGCVVAGLGSDRYMNLKNDMYDKEFKESFTDWILELGEEVQLRIEAKLDKESRKLEKKFKSI